MATVSLRHLHKSFGTVSVIGDVSLDVSDGEFLALVGPSGSGKSTLLRVIAGLEEATAGEILMDGRRMNDVPAKLRDIAMVFQNYALYPHMTVRQNMSFALRMRRLSRPEITGRVDEVARSLDLTALLDRYPRQLSGGQRQRVATGRAIVRQPRLFLFDEPLSNLDAKLRVHVRAELRAMHRELGVTSIYVTHDQVEAMTMADRIVVLRDGAVEQVGAPLELYDRPANIFVAGFIGSPAINLLDGRRKGDAIALLDGSMTAIRPNCGAVDGEALTLGIRPEHVTLNGEAGLPARLVAVEQTGAETTALCDSGGTSITAVLRERLTAPLGTSVRLTLSPDRHHYFDQQGRRLNAR